MTNPKVILMPLQHNCCRCGKGHGKRCLSVKPSPFGIVVKIARALKAFCLKLRGRLKSHLCFIPDICMYFTCIASLNHYNNRVTSAIIIPILQKGNWAWRRLNGLPEVSTAWGEVVVPTSNPGFPTLHSTPLQSCLFMLVCSGKKKNNQNIAQEVHSIRDIRGFFFVAVFTIKTETFWPVSVSEKVSKVHQ